jgi:radical SAM superfamily enzyme YgiQ (UPF0313 family)
MVASHDADFYIGRRGGPPLNLAYLASAVSSASFEYDVIDALATEYSFYLKKYKLHIQGLDFCEIVQKIKPCTNIVGISAMFTNEWLVVRELILSIKKKYPDMLIVVGGEHVTAMAKHILLYEQYIDICFLGESEDSIVKFLSNFECGNIYKTPGIVYKNSSGEIKINPRASRLTDINNLFPNWDKIPVQFYIENRYSFSRIDVKSMPILATRGCPYKCTFCSNANMWGYRYVMRDVSVIVREMKSYIKKYGVSHFDFLDLATSVHRKWFIELLKRLITELPGITWEMSVGTRSEILDREVLMLLKESGTLQLAYAPETGSRRLAKFIKKQINFERMYHSVKEAIDLGIDVKANTIIGFPQETIWDLLQTIWMALKLGWLGAKGVSLFVFTPYPGSEISDKELGYDNLSREEYEHILTYQSKNAAGARVFDFTELFTYPKSQIYTLITNVVMVVSYFVSAIRRPRYLKELYVNIKNDCPACPMEVALHSLLKG